MMKLGQLVSSKYSQIGAAFLSYTMDKHALALLNDGVLWKMMGLTKFEASHP
jgi:hypothetical protein